MKTFSSALHLLRRAFLRRRPLSRQTSRPAAIVQSLVRLLCVERKGALVCCMPGAPIVRLPH
ncbi:MULTISPECIES: hypothetical protein [Pseudomonas]|uniref:Uncharacterized protein n=1 Tax=Pseudomonas chlororaphis O6 TaxID=1037915 RepID=A0AB33WQE2_9PSED|nr:MULTISPECIES: hypothetical protein [Pseudomonas]AZC62969.1 hypothetical protein C4K33_2477 [Pseudomonas chlororaphis subsp. piscium]AZD85507.1 hypothetical protein C4K14_2683 [Pseudomonas chlororaphis subsp. aureofaciens]AZD91945.1 hypothetical protein C4K13_2528 [Pseudomonas chlororaphis subsp. aureofaciens]AZD98433.1 hypothetical protein C4K12_2567 [Pseudomonas chlororaphis subsp. aureofaciens]AZE04657.1 hypothetical protein C4K11_2495 [Pseudomonas chlororaphis subsp. aureofaciens]